MDSQTIARSGPTPTRARPRRRVLSFALLLLGAVALAGCGPELGPVAKLAAIWQPTLPELSDPSVLRVDSKYYVYGSNNHLRAPVTETFDIDRAYTLSEKNRLTHEGMPTQPAWASSTKQFWAPTVAQMDGRWIMFFSADRRNPPQPWNAQCVGRAWSNSPSGPFVPDPSPFTCGLGGVGGALDPEVFTDNDGRSYLLVAFGDTESPLHSIPLDWWGNPAGDAVPILTRQHPWEYHFIEQPAMTYDWTRGSYLLAYSAGRWWEAAYSTGIARCSSPVGPCTSDPSGPWIASSNGRTGPGGLSFFSDTTGRGRAIFSSFQAGWETQVGGRSGTVMPLTLDPAVGLGDVVK